MENKKILKNNKGITLVALVITIIVLLILASVTLRMVVGENGILKRAEQAKNIWEEAAQKEQNELESIFKDEEDANVEKVTYQIMININVKSYNTTLGEFPTIFKITGKYNGKIVYEDMASANINNVGIEKTSLEILVPKGTVLTVSEVYSGTNYNLVSENNIEKALTEGEQAEFNFEYEYNNGLIINSGISI